MLDSTLIRRLFGAAGILALLGGSLLTISWLIDARRTTPVTDAQPAAVVTIFVTASSAVSATPTPSAMPVSQATPTTAPLPTTKPAPVAAATLVVPVASRATPELIMLVPPAAAAQPAVPAAATAIPLVLPTATPIPVPVAGACPASSSAVYGLIAADGVYKSNRLTDLNADLRLSVIGYVAVVEPLTLIDYNGATDPGAPKLGGMLGPWRAAAFVRAYRRHDWNWDEYAGPPHGARLGVNSDWPVTVVDLAASPGESVYIPERDADIGGYTAMVLFAGENEITLAYHRQDSVTDGYVVHMLGFCVDPNLVALYRAQTSDGKRATGRLPALRNGERIGVAKSAALTVAIRDRGAFMDPRSRKDWW